MIINEPKKRLTDEAIKNIPEPTKDKIKSIIENATVLLSGDGFTGSGVLLYSQGNTYYVLTAAHNILISAKGRNIVPSLDVAKLINNKDNTEKLFSNFKERCCVKFNVGDSRIMTETEFVNPKIISARLVDKWDTDLCLLKFDSGEFRKPQRTLWGELTQDGLKEKLNKQNEFLSVLNDKVYEKKDKNPKYVFIQAGYGMLVRGSAENYIGTLNNLKYRVVDFIRNSQTEKFDIGPYGVKIDDSTCLYNNVLLFASDKDDTSMPGDSGGPVYGVELYNDDPKPLIYLVGITLGSDFYKDGEVKIKDDTQEPDGYKNNAATSTQPFFDKFVY
ncbi:hypothetical protein [Dickeya solani]|nr:hypothetical protein [Dickeya solani]